MVGDTLLLEGEFEVTLQATSSGENAVGVTSTGFVLLNLTVTEDLEQEGAARDAIRHIQQARKDANFDVSDRIHLTLRADAKSKVALEKHAELIASETLATKLEITQGEGSLTIGDDGLIQIELVKQ
jgi:isoleucyl-tRNA synthetase